MKINPKAWLRADAQDVSVELQPNIREITDFSSTTFTRKIPENCFSLIKSIGPLSDWVLHADRIVSITRASYLSTEVKVDFPNCTSLSLAETSLETLPLKSFPKLKRLHIQNSYKCKIVGTVSGLEEVSILGFAVPDELRKVVTTMEGAPSKCFPKLRKLVCSGKDLEVYLRRQQPESEYCICGEWCSFEQEQEQQQQRIEELYFTFSLKTNNNRILRMIAGWQNLQVLHLISFQKVFERLQPMMNLRQLVVFYTFNKDGDTLPPWLMKMRKLNKLVVNTHIKNWEFIPDHLYFISELRFPIHTRTLLRTRLSDGWFPFIGPLTPGDTNRVPPCYVW